MSSLSKSARRTLNRIGKASGKNAPVIHRDTKERYYLQDGKEVTGAGLWELLDKGVFTPAEDGLFPGFTQTFTLNTSAL